MNEISKESSGNFGHLKSPTRTVPPYIIKRFEVVRYSRNCGGDDCIVLSLISVESSYGTII